ncbi:MAG: hypothetical protein IJV07_05120 [Alphaproteobacteria bacterium]|nr:hypothetical protein [Alphaproteobacteria bacterium]
MVNKFLKMMLAGAIILGAQGAVACWYEGVVIEIVNGEIVSVKHDGKELEGSLRERALRKFYEVQEKYGKPTDGTQTWNGGDYFGKSDGGYGTGSGGTDMEKLRQEIIKVMLVKRDTVAGKEQEYDFQNNINSVRENQNKIQVNAATRAVAMGKRAVALATKSGKEDIDAMGKVIEQNDDVLNMLKGVAKLQAQHLQKTNEITALRAKIVELNSIDNIIAGDVYTTDKTAQSGSKI